MIEIISISQKESLNKDSCDYSDKNNNDQIPEYIPDIENMVPITKTDLYDVEGRVIGKLEYIDGIIRIENLMTSTVEFVIIGNSNSYYYSFESGGTVIPIEIAKVNNILYFKVIPENEEGQNV